MRETLNSDIILIFVVMNSNVHAVCYQDVFCNGNYLGHMLHIDLFSYLEITPEGQYNCIRICLDNSGRQLYLLLKTPVSNEKKLVPITFPIIW